MTTSSRRTAGVPAGSHWREEQALRRVAESSAQSRPALHLRLKAAASVLGGAPVLAIVLAACSTPLVPAGPRWPSPWGNDPAVALTVRQISCEAEAPALLCTGTLIAPRVVLTTTHCLRAQPPAAIDVVFGDFFHGKRVHVTTGIVHPQFNPQTHAHDVGLLLLAEEAPQDTRPAKLPEKALDPSLIGAPIRWIGYGAPHGAEADAGTRREGQAVVAEITADEVRYRSAVAMTCRGDSGGPLLVRRGSQEELVGVTTWGDPGCRYFGAAARIDRQVDFMRPFLRSVRQKVRARPTLDLDKGVAGVGCESNADCPEQTTCFGWPEQTRWCTYAGLPRGRFTHACVSDAQCGTDNLCVALPGGCRCFERAATPDRSQ
jgi:V8-like Glu-specific endopeptidase